MMAALLYCTVLYYTVLYSTLLHSTLLYSTLLYSTLLHSTLLYSTLLYSTLLYFALFYSTLLYCTLFYLLYSTLFYLLYSTIPSQCCLVLYTSHFYSSSFRLHYLFHLLFYSSSLQRTSHHQFFFYRIFVFLFLKFQSLMDGFSQSDSHFEALNSLKNPNHKVLNSNKSFPCFFQIIFYHIFFFIIFFNSHSFNFFIFCFSFLRIFVIGSRCRFYFCLLFCLYILLIFPLQ